nr:peptidoglycan DD-metalloendopeptidase family protein [Nocardioides humi]
MLVMVSIAMLMNPAANAACTIGTGNGVTVGNIPDSLDVTTADGTTFTLNHQQLTHAATIIDIGSRTDGVNRNGIQIALMAALTESTLRMLSNTSAYPESANYPNDGDGSDNDSLGLFQMRPAAGWGAVAELMDPTYQAKAFYGGPTGPNYPSPRGLLDIPGWRQMDKGAAAQAVEVSAYPDRYRNYEPVAAAILDALTARAASTAGQVDLPTVVTSPINGKIGVAQANIPNRTSSGRFASSMGWLTSQGPDFITLNEVSARSLEAISAHAPGYAAYRQRQADGNQSQGNVVLWKTAIWSKLAAGRIKLVEADHAYYQGKKVTWDRFATWALLQRGDGAVVSIVSVHQMTDPHKFPRQHGNPSMSRPEQYGKGMDILIGLLNQLGQHGPVFVGGDMNTPASYTDLAWSAAAKMKTAGYAWHAHGVDFVFYPSGNGVKLAHGTVGPKAEVGDHNMIAARFNLNHAGTTARTSSAANTASRRAATAPAITRVTAQAQGPESSRVVFPLPADTWAMSSPFGMRVHPITGEYKLHTGTDFSTAAGTPILAAADGTVTFAGPAAGYGNLIIIEHTIDGQTIATAYAHMWPAGIHVAVGDRVTAGQHIGDVGSSGYATGPHLHFEVRPGGTNAAPVDPVPWLNAHGAADLPAANGGPGSSTTGCDSTGLAPGIGVVPTPVDGDPNRMVDDPTSTGQITARLLNLYIQASAAFPDTGWACWSERPGTTSEHPLGRACDITFGNAIGHYPTPAQLEAGWALTDWMKNNAEALGVEYLIWQGKVWSVARSGEGWRPYNGGGAHDPDNVTGGHYDHLHVTVRN